MQTLHNQQPAVLKFLNPVGRLSSTNRLNLAIGLPARNTAALSNLLQQIYDPSSTNYHRYLTPDQFTERFGPTDSNYQAVIAFAKENHLQVTYIHPNRLLLDITGSVQDIEHALHVTLHTYLHPMEKRKFFAADTDPTLDLTTPVLHISGLDNYSLPQPHMVAKPLVNMQNAKLNGGSGTGGTYFGNDFRAAYVPGTTLNGSGQTVGLLQFDGYTASDITFYENKAGLPNVPLQNVLMDGATGTPSFTGGEVEVSLDIEMVIAMATNLSKVIIYEATNGAPFVDLLNRMATDNLAKQLSCSWFKPDGVADPMADLIFQQMALQGQSFFNASGDNDAYTGLIDFPGDSPYITQVGGTTLTTSGAGGSWSSETVWNSGGGIGSGGGISTQYGIPAWQTNISMTDNQGSTGKRNTPDVALTADKIYVRADGSDYTVTGTSAAAPLWAGFAALVNQKAASSGQPLIGFINPALSAMGTSASYSKIFHDITTGNNESPSSLSTFTAVSNYDLCTGWGTPAGQILINALAIPEPLLITPVAGFTTTGGAGGPFTLTAQSFTLTNLGTNSLSWSLTNTSLWLNVSSMGGNLAPGGSSTNVLVSLNATASNLLAGTYSATILFTNLNDNFIQNRHFMLSVIAPPHITQEPTNQYVIENAAAQFSVQAFGGLQLSYQWQDNGTNLIDDGNVSGSTTTNLVVSTVLVSNIGIYTVIVTNMAGIATSSNALLAIIPSAPVIIVQPTNQVVSVGVATMFKVTAHGSSPLHFQWEFNGTNINAATNTTLLLINVQLTNTGNYAVVVTNFYGLTNSFSASLTVLTSSICSTVPSGIVAWWAAESNALDSVGTNNGVLMNGVAFAAGESGTAFDLSSANTYVLVNSTNLDVGNGNGMTFECWINPTTTGTQMPLFEYERSVGSGDGSDIGPQVYINLAPPSGNGAGSIMVNLSDTTQGHVFASPSGLVIADIWQHIAVTYDKTSGLSIIYVNGSAVAQANFGNITPQTSFGNFLIGARTYFGSASSPSDKFYGEMDEVSLYDRALSATEIATIYQIGSLGKCYTPMPPIIVTQPTNQILPVGSVTAMSVTAIGTPPLMYQWSANGKNIIGATNSVLALTNVQLTNTGYYSVLVTNLYGSTNSIAATLTVFGLPPSILTQPTNRSVQVGGSAVFNVTAAGSPPLFYQWNFNGTNITGTTNPVLALANVQLTNTGNYSVAISNLFGMTNSASAVLTVFGIPPSILIQPTNVVAQVGSAATFSVTATGTPSVFFQWSLNGTNINRATNFTYVLNNIQSINAGTYTVAVTNMFGSTNSVAVILTVIPLPTCDSAASGIVGWWAAESNALDSVGINNGTLMNATGFANGESGTTFNLNGVNNYILVSSTNLNVGAGNGITFECWINPNSITTQMPLAYWENILGSSNPANAGMLFYTSLSPSTGTGAGCLVANISDTAGNSHVISSAPNLLTSGAWQHVALTYDKISGIGAIYLNGMSIVQTNLGNFSPQTSFTNLLIGGHTTYGSVSNPSDKFSGKIDEVSLYGRALTSNEIAAIYLASSMGKCPLSPTIIIQPTNRTVNAGNVATLQVAAVGTPKLGYQWSLNGTNINGATNTTLVLANTQLTNAGTYAVVVTNGAGLATSSNAVLVVQATPVFLTQPTNQTVAAGSSTTFSATVSGSPTLNFQWRFNGTNIDGATNLPLVLMNLQFTNGGNYSLRVTNLFGSATGSNAVLNVLAPPTIYTQPTNLTLFVGNTAVFNLAVVGSPVLGYQWSLNGTNHSITGATNATLTISNVQLASAGSYTLTATNPYGLAVSSNAALNVIDVLDHFTWGPVPSPRFVNAPFNVTVQARDSINQLFTNFGGMILLSTTNGIPLNPAVSSNFSQGAWTSSITIAQIITNLVLRADDGTGHTGLANSINIVNPPSLSMVKSDNSLFIYWPTIPAGFALENSDGLAPAHWTQVSVPPFQIGNQYLESIQLNGTNQFYRLHFILP